MSAGSDGSDNSITLALPLLGFLILSLGCTSTFITGGFISVAGDSKFTSGSMVFEVLYLSPSSIGTDGFMLTLSLDTANTGAIG